MDTSQTNAEPSYFSVTDPDVWRSVLHAKLPDLIERIERSLSEQAQHSRDVLAFLEMMEEQTSEDKVGASLRALRGLTFKWDHQLCVVGSYLDVLVKRLDEAGTSASPAGRK